MSERYRLRTLTRREVSQGYTIPYRVERKSGWFSWTTVESTTDPDRFKEIVEVDMWRRRKEANAEYARKSFIPIHAVAHWLLTVERRVKGAHPELHVQIDTKG